MRYISMTNIMQERGNSFWRKYMCALSNSIVQPEDLRKMYANLAWSLQKQWPIRRRVSAHHLIRYAISPLPLVFSPILLLVQKALVSVQGRQVRGQRRQQFDDPPAGDHFRYSGATAVGGIGARAPDLDHDGLFGKILRKPTDPVWEGGEDQVLVQVVELQQHPDQDRWREVQPGPQKQAKKLFLAGTSPQDRGELKSKASRRLFTVSPLWTGCFWNRSRVLIAVIVAPKDVVATVLRENFLQSEKPTSERANFKSPLQWRTFSLPNVVVCTPPMELATANFPLVLSMLVTVMLDLITCGCAWRGRRTRPARARRWLSRSWPGTTPLSKQSLRRKVF